MAEQEQGSVKQNYNNATTGLNMDNTLNQIEKGKLTYALNAVVENFDSNSVNYQNELGNELCLSFPSGFVLIGTYFIQEKNKHIFFITNPVTGGSQIGYMENNDCVYRVIVNAPCLNFNTDYPIHKVAHKITNCTTEIYWTDGYNPRRYLDIDDIPKVLRSGTPFCNPEYTDDLDCNQLRLQPNFKIPELEVIDVVSVGNLIAGTYQFAIQYSDSQGNPYTSYYSITNPTPIADKFITSVNFNYPVGKSIVLNISNLEDTGLYQYYNLAVIKTVNSITSVELVGTFYIDNLQKQVTYNGQNVTQIRLTIDDIFEKFPYYDIAQDLTNVQDILLWDNLTSIDRINYQSIASGINLFWETWRIPGNENYSDELNATNLRGYLRDEVYAFEIVFLLKNGKQTDGFHIPGRIKSTSEALNPDVSELNPDFIGVPTYYSGGVGYSPYWKIYNTGSVIGNSPQFSPSEEYKGPYQFGEFAYWESTETYPCNKAVWGDLSGQPIRHHKFPDINISPAYESKIFTGPTGLVSGNDAVFPIGVRIDTQQVYSLIQTSNLTDEQKDDIVAFKIVRGDRGTNKSIVAKGILRNVNTYEREKQTYFYPNYPYNDLTQDPFLNKTNNAWSELCESYTVNIKTLGADPDGGAPFAEIQYVDCNTNKQGKIKYLTTGTREVCSIGRPVILFPAKGEVTNSTYELWEAKACGGFPPFRRGGTVEWSNALTGTIKTDWIPGFLGGGRIKLYVVPGTGGPKQVGGPGKICFTGPTLVTGANCSDPLPQPGFSEKYRQIFNSPETSFGQPFLGNILKLESVMFGGGKAHFVEVRNNAKYKLLTEEAQRDALKSAERLGNLTDPFNATAMFTAYQAYLTIYVNGITRKNYAYSFNSTADYNYGTGVPDNQGVKQRNLDIARYLIPGVQNVGDAYNINNWNRESSVYLRTDLNKSSLPFPDQSPNMGSGGTSILIDKSRFTISDVGNCDAPAEEKDISVVSYYASLKNVFPNQYGQIYSYEKVDTGFQSLLTPTSSTSQIIFGGDTFISRFAFKTKLPFFIDNRVNAPDDSDIFYDEIGNVAYPKYWHSARSILKDFNITKAGLMTSIISYKAHNFDCPNSQEPGPQDAGPNNNPVARGAQENPNRTFYDGYFYLFAYGIPNFYCESSYNVDLRQAFNNREGDFWPHVSSGIPDDWLQESFVSIIQDNTYNYNITYSKQNKENTFTNLPIDWDKPCYTYYPFRAIYSDSQNTDADNRVNSWLIYRSISYFDFPQNYGNLTSVDGIQNRAILARFENKSLLYNNLLTVDTSNPQAAYLGNPSLFKGAPPIDFAETDLGYVGSQNKMLLKIPQGQVTIDAKRGQVFLVSGSQVIDLSAFGSGLNRFFTDHLAFEILRYFPDVPTDNHFNGVGLHGVYDSNYDRVIITKLDYIPKNNSIRWDSVNREFYIDEKFDLGDVTTTIRRTVYLNDEEQFCNKGWTLSYNFNTKSWVSFHSYLPNWYIGENNFFYSGVNGCCEDFDILAATVGPIPSTTTTSSTSTSSTSSTTTTTTTLNCTLQGNVIVTSCALSGTAIITVPPTPPPCVRPETLTFDAFFTGYDIVSPSSTVVSTASMMDACDAVSYLNTFGEEYVNVFPNYISVEYQGLFGGSEVYASNGTNDCTTIPDGWYFTEQSQSNNTVFNVVGGVIVSVNSCGTTDACYNLSLGTIPVSGTFGSSASGTITVTGGNVNVWAKYNSGGTSSGTTSFTLTIGTTNASGTFIVSSFGQVGYTTLGGTAGTGHISLSPGTYTFTLTKIDSLGSGSNVGLSWSEGVINNLSTDMVSCSITTTTTTTVPSTTTSTTSTTTTTPP